MDTVQKFQRGDVVKVDDVLPDFMSHFRYAGQVVTIEGSYHDLYRSMSNGGRHKTEYSVTGPQGGSSWYPEAVLTLVKRCPRCPHCHQPLSIEGE